MKGEKTKIEITKADVDGLHFVDIYIPRVENEGDGAEFTVFHHKDYIHIAFPTHHNPAYFYKPCPDYSYEKVEDELWKKYDVEDFFKREFMIVDGEQS